MNIIKNSDSVLKCFEKEYAKRNAMRIRVVDDSVILVCGLRSSYNRLFDLYYACIPVFSDFGTDISFLNDANAFQVCLELGEETILPITPKPDEADSVIETAFMHAEYAYSKLQNVRNLNDCLSFYEAMCENDAKFTGYYSFVRRQHIDILLFKREFNKCRSLLESSLLGRIKWIFRESGIMFPQDGNWERLLPKNEESIRSPFESDLFYSNESFWKEFRLALEHKAYYELCNPLMEQYLKNKRLLKKLGIQVGTKSDSAMEEMMNSVRSYKMMNSR